MKFEVSRLEVGCFEVSKLELQGSRSEVGGSGFELWRPLEGKKRGSDLGKKLETC